jgi:hypothetical protein
MSTGTVQRTVVVLPERWAGVLPAAALPALRAAERVLADATVPEEVVAATGATRADTWGDDGAPEVLLTTDPARADGEAVVGPPAGAAHVFEEAGSSIGELTALLAAAGYELRTLGSGKLLPNDAGELTNVIPAGGGINALALPPN